MNPNAYKQKKLELTEGDHRVLEIIGDFVPDNVFDAHAHLNPAGGLSDEAQTYESYCEWMGPLLGNPSNIRLNALAEVTGPNVRSIEGRREINDYLSEQLAKAPNCVGSAFIGPDETEEQIAEVLSRPQMVGIKCYATTVANPDRNAVAIGDFLSEAQWTVANRLKRPICLHMMRPKALSDPDNLAYIQKMTARYPDAKLVLAHCARGFAGWNTIEAIDKIAHIDNVWYDISAICEVGTIASTIMRTAGKKVMWGSDYPVCKYRGCSLSMGDSFLWITGATYATLEPTLEEKGLKPCLYTLQTMLAFKQTATLLNLDRTQIEDIFYNNAMNLYGLKD